VQILTPIVYRGLPVKNRREWVIEPTQGLLKQEKHTLSPSQQKAIKECAFEFRRGMLGGRKPKGWCFAVCAPLQTLLWLNLHIEAELERLQFPATDQVILRLAADLILDPTADQWAVGLPPVYLGPMPSAYELWMKEYDESR
jgi:hypothetical protein